MSKKCCLFTLVFVGTPALVILWLVLLTVRVDADKLTWPEVFIPFWLATPVAWLAFLYYYLASEVWEAHPAIGGALWASVIMVMIDAFTILLVIQLQLSNFVLSSLAMSWNWVFLPLWFAFAMVMTVDVNFPARRPSGLHGDNVVGALISNLKIGLLVFSVVVLLKLDGIIGHSIPWSVIFVPLYWIPFVPALLCVDEVIRRLSQQQDTDLSGCQLFLSFLASAWVAIIIVMIALTCDGIIPWISVGLIPVWITLTCYFFASCCVTSWLL